MEEGYNPAMSEEAKRAVKTICEDMLIKEAQACDEDQDPSHTYESYLNECGSYMTECMMNAASNLKVEESSHRNEYTLDCKYYDRKFTTVDALLDDIISSGMDPNYEILRNGEPTGETAWDLIGDQA